MISEVSKNAEVSRNYSLASPKHYKLSIYLTHVTLILICFIIIHWVFKTAITDLVLSNTIALGSIFSTFGAAIISIFMVIENDKYTRIMANVDILFKDILKINKWRRWQFLDRKAHGKNLDNTKMEMKLDNPDVIFNIGSHLFGVHIPTVLEDVYDLSAYRTLWKMYKYKKHFFTTVTSTNNTSKLDGTASQIGWMHLWLGVVYMIFGKLL
jgi:hypothetical protein